jgi:hypothetical protein
MSSTPVNNPGEKPSGGLLGSKWAIPGLDVLTARRARGLHATFKEQEKVSEMKSGPFRLFAHLFYRIQGFLILGFLMKGGKVGKPEAPSNFISPISSQQTGCSVPLPHHRT